MIVYFSKSSQKRKTAEKEMRAFWTTSNKLVIYHSISFTFPLDKLGNYSTLLPQMLMRTFYKSKSMKLGLITWFFLVILKSENPEEDFLHMISPVAFSYKPVYKSISAIWFLSVKHIRIKLLPLKKNMKKLKGSVFAPGPMHDNAAENLSTNGEFLRFRELHWNSYSTHRAKWASAMILVIKEQIQNIMLSGDQYFCHAPIVALEIGALANSQALHSLKILQRRTGWRSGEELSKESKGAFRNLCVISQKSCLTSKCKINLNLRSKI